MSAIRPHVGVEVFGVTIAWVGPFGVLTNWRLARIAMQQAMQEHRLSAGGATKTNPGDRALRIQDLLVRSAMLVIDPTTGQRPFSFHNERS